MVATSTSPTKAQDRPLLVSGFDHLVLHYRPHFFAGVVVALAADFLVALFAPSTLPIVSAAEVGLAIGTLALAYAGLLQLASSVESRREEAEWRQHLREVREREDRNTNRSEYRRHGLWLNQAVFQHLPSLRLQKEVGYPQMHDGSGLVVIWANNDVLLVERLPNWPQAIQHLTSDVHLRQSVEAVTRSSLGYYYVRADTFKQLVAKLSELVEKEYGPEMRVKDVWEGQVPPWCNVERMAWVALTQAENPDFLKQPLFNSPNQSFVALANIQFLGGRNSEELDSTRLQRIWDRVRSDEELAAGMKQVVENCRQAKEQISVFGEQALHYSNRLAMTEDFEGECDECSKRWKPR